MGLGLNGGGLAAAQFLAKEGADLCITDLRDADELEPTLNELKGQSIRYVLGRHEDRDFSEADMVIKNPAVPANSHFLKISRRVETDLSLFLSYVDNPILAVTGSKGKSTIVSALHHIMKQSYHNCRLGGNITISPLTFIDEIDREDPIILELSSWQLADLHGKGLLNPKIAMISNIMHDHQNRYDSFQDYIDDKLAIFLEQDPKNLAILPIEEKYRGWDQLKGGCKTFFSMSESNYETNLLFGFKNNKGIFHNPQGNEEVLIDGDLHLPGSHIRGNILAAASMARLYGVPKRKVLEAIKSFQGVPHRMELIRTWNNISFYNDTAATLPDAMVAGMESFESGPLLILGGTDKELDFSVMKGKMSNAKACIFLEGSATKHMRELMDREGVTYQGPYNNLREAFEKSLQLAEAGDVVLLSPGAASFGMFKNEFDRGNQFRSLVESL